MRLSGLENLQIVRDRPNITLDGKSKIHAKFDSNDYSHCDKYVQNELCMHSHSSDRGSTWHCAPLSGTRTSAIHFVDCKHSRVLSHHMHTLNINSELLLWNNNQTNNQIVFCFSNRGKWAILLLGCHDPYTLCCFR